MAKSKAKAVRHEEDAKSEVDQDSPTVEDQSQDHDEGVGADEADDVDTSNKAGLVRAALAAGHTKPREGVRWIKETYGVEIAGTYFSVAKSQQAKRSGEALASRSSPPSTEQRPVASPSSAGVPAGFGGDVRTLRGLLADNHNEADAVKDLVATVDTLVRKYGVSGLNEMIDAFSE